MTTILHYFAYGSNMHPNRLRARVPSARAVGRAELPGHMLRFHKRGRDHSGKCNALATGRPADRIIGVIYDMAAAERIHLDMAEGLGAGYELDYATLPCQGQSREVFFYRAHPDHTDDSLRPFDWYRALVLEGGRFHSLPQTYLALIEAVETMMDLNGARRELHQRLLSP